ncbi:MAG: 2-(3-amino-3-carboxypropyl)histidine synthase [Candidatus Diapherotrites archaeon]|nr:2-(3-amino-3-carboxypropyl)histidine synthase [Candidatus Diapherotrites archaeon]MDN5367225.1 2-(3-amino-3-carboxypropyl)histidine synthase [Candidatus Diapherotrites archaeon]
MIERLESTIKKIEVEGKVVAVQIPEGLKQYADRIIDALHKRRAKNVFLFIDPNFGACDLKDGEARKLGADVLIHFGHNRFGRITKTEIPVIYVPITLELDVEKIVTALKKVEGKIALCTTVQYLPYLKEIKKRLGDKIVIGRGVLATEEGQVLGCDPGACNVDADVNVIITDGIFHGVLARMQTGRRTYILTPAGKLIDVEPHVDKYIRQREAAKMLAREAKRVGVVITTKKGQMYADVAERVAEVIRKAGVKVDILVCDYFYPEYVEGMPYDAYVFTGCPRVPIDDYTRFKKPVLTVAEAMEVWGEA